MNIDIPFPSRANLCADNVADRVEFQYNRIGERIGRKDQNGTVHAYEFDNLG